ncbi:cell division protein FtsL [Candidatus Endowatersipora endosymbiont of Watersipora subatra]|uniref:cell division protein FtsL n=1 Tax=Candidatus Endowatersipora endosymbiont of Watersipora subatra TaxID=3077946 RepID=UPI00312CAAA1
MIRVTHILMMGSVLIVTIWTYGIKHESKQSAKTLVRLRGELAKQNTKISLLEADWAIMTNPDRLEKIAKKFQSQLQLQAIQSNQIIQLDELASFFSIVKNKGSDLDGHSTTDEINSLVYK